MLLIIYCLINLGSMWEKCKFFYALCLHHKAIPKKMAGGKEYGRRKEKGN